MGQSFLRINPANDYWAVLDQKESVGERRRRKRGEKKKRRKDSFILFMYLELDIDFNPHLPAVS